MKSPGHSALRWCRRRQLPSPNLGRSTVRSYLRMLLRNLRQTPLPGRSMLRSCLQMRLPNPRKNQVRHLRNQRPRHRNPPPER